MEAVLTYGCFEAVYDKLTPELQDAVFGKPMMDLFALPTEVKMKNISNKPSHGYIGNESGFETLYIDKVAEHDGLTDFSALMWGDDGNPSFREAVVPFVNQLSELEQIARKMILESLGVEKYFDEFVRSTVDALRMSKYGAKQIDSTAKTSLASHTDPNVLTIVCQRGVEGLEVQTKDGKWLTPSPNSFTVIMGQAFWAWSNGRIEPPWHRVVTADDKTRYSTLFVVIPRDGYVVQAPDELVDDEHPLQFRPYDYVEYLKFSFSGAAANYGFALKEYCGVQEATIDAGEAVA